MPVWQELLAPEVAAGRLKVVGIVQEQHADRARLYRQWRAIDWPILIDSLGLLDLAVVPVLIGVDESGTVRLTGNLDAKSLGEFLARPPVAGKAAAVVPPDLVELSKKGGGKPRDRGDAFFIAGQTAGDLDAAIDAYEKAVAADAADARAKFRLGVALRRRSEGPSARAGDAQAAVVRWGEALAQVPEQYIWRRRIQQYGPRLVKPYNFFSWVDEARQAIRARGDQPVALAEEPAGSEIAAPTKKSDGAAEALAVPDPDPKAGLPVDSKAVVLVETSVTPARVRPGGRVRVRFDFRPVAGAADWGDGIELPVISPKLPARLRLVEGTLAGALEGALPSKVEKIVREIELEVAEDATAGTIDVQGYAAYGVCEDDSGVCRLLRRNWSFRIVVDPKAQTID